MGFITKFLSFVDLAVENGFEFLSGDRENDIDVLEFQLGFGHVDLIFSDMDFRYRDTFLTKFAGK